MILLLTGPEPLSFTTLTVSPTEVSFKVFIFSPSFLSNQDFGCHIFSNGYPGIFHIHDEIAVDFRYDCHVSANDEAKIFKKSSGLFFSANFSDSPGFAIVKGIVNYLLCMIMSFISISVVSIC
jgi:hypothetical protein